MVLSGARPIVTGFRSIAIFLSAFPSNFKMSKAISIISSRRSEPARVSGPTAQPVEPAIRSKTDSHDHHGNVVFPAAVVGPLDQTVGGSLCVRGGLPQACNLIVRDHAGQSVRAEKQSVVIEQSEFVHVHFDFFVGPEG